MYLPTTLQMPATDVRVSLIAVIITYVPATTTRAPIV